MQEDIPAEERTHYWDQPSPCSTPGITADTYGFDRATSNTFDIDEIYGRHQYISEESVPFETRQDYLRSTMLLLERPLSLTAYKLARQHLESRVTPNGRTLYRIKPYMRQRIEAIYKFAATIIFCILQPNVDPFILPGGSWTPPERTADSTFQRLGISPIEIPYYTPSGGWGYGDEDSPLIIWRSSAPAALQYGQFLLDSASRVEVWFAEIRALTAGMDEFNWDWIEKDISDDGLRGNAIYYNYGIHVELGRIPVKQHVCGVTTHRHPLNKCSARDESTIPPATQKTIKQNCLFDSRQSLHHLCSFRNPHYDIIWNKAHNFHVLLRSYLFHPFICECYYCKPAYGNITFSKEFRVLFLLHAACLSIYTEDPFALPLIANPRYADDSELYYYLPGLGDALEDILPGYEPNKHRDLSVDTSIEFNPRDWIVDAGTEDESSESPPPLTDIATTDSDFKLSPIRYVSPIPKSPPPFSPSFDWISPETSTTSSMDFFAPYLPRPGSPEFIVIDSD
jgi:hypothetical protein